MNMTASTAEDSEMEDLSQCSQEDEESRRRQLRRAYRDLINRTVADPDDETAVPPTETLDEAKELFSKVTRTQEAVLDSKLMVLMASKGRKCASLLPINLHAFDAEEFAGRALSIMGTSAPVGQKLDLAAWAQLGRFAEEPLKRSAPFWYLYGAAGEVPPRVRQARRTVVEAPDRPETVAKKVSSGDRTNKETTTEHVGHIHGLLKALHSRLGGPLPYHEFVIHPTSFSKTCENIFHLSFLINEGHARIIEEDGLLLVEPVDRTSSSAASQVANRNGVFVKTLTMTQWREAVQGLGIREPTIAD
ncbi:unnamed protein product [Ixodes pacificus]